MARAKKSATVETAADPVAALPAASTPAATAPVIAFKGMDRDMRCRDFQYAIGQTYTLPSGKPARCMSHGFHACEHPFHVWSYYPLGEGNRFFEVGLDGAVDRLEGEDTKVAAASITIRAELSLPDFIRRGAAWIMERAKGNTATGYSGHAAATGYSGHAAATGNSGHAAATGYSGHAAATGYRGHAAATGYSGHAAATGDRGHAAATGDSGHAAATGYSGHAAATGYSGIAASLGIEGTATAGETSWIVLAAWKRGDLGWEIVTVRTARVGGPEGIKPGARYRLSEAGEFVEVQA